MCLPNITETTCFIVRVGCESCFLLLKDFSTLFSKQNIVKFSYIFLLLCSILLIIILTNFGLNYLSYFQYYIHCPIESGGEMNCLGLSIIFRACFSLFLLHVTMLFFCSMRNWISEKINEEFWFTKIFLLAIIFLFSFYIPNWFFQLFSDLSKILAILFIIFQIIMMIDIFYLWGETWINKYMSSNSFCWGILLILTTILLYFFTIYVNLHSFYYFTEKLSRNTFFIVLNIILIVISSLLTISGVASNGSLLTSGGVSLYQTYSLWSGLTNSPKESNEFYGSHFPLNSQIFIGILVIIISLSYVSSSKNYFGTEIDNSEQNQDIELNENLNPERNKENLEKNVESNKIYSESNIYIYYHLTMIMGTFYVSMLFTNWGADDLNAKIIFIYKINESNYWIQIISSWIIFGIYAWTLIAPKILSEREFN